MFIARGSRQTGTPAHATPPADRRAPAGRWRAALRALAPACLALAALATPAAAQTVTEVWSATLTVADFSTSVGCTAHPFPERQCPNALTEDEFNHDSRDYDVTDIHLQSTGRLEIHFDPNLATATQSLVLNVGTPTFADGTVSFAFEDADVKNNDDRRWNSSGLSWSAGDEIELSLTEPVAPDAPTNLTATADGQTEIDLSWTAPANNGGTAITGYKIEVSPDGVSTNWSELAANTGATGTTYSQTGLSAGDTRYYRVSAINLKGAGSASNVANATTEAAVPDAPTNLTATADGQTAIDLSWTAPANDNGAAITGYKIEVSSDGGTSWSDDPADTGDTGTTYSHTGLAAESTRHYRVSAINSKGASLPSNVANATTDAAPPVNEVWSATLNVKSLGFGILGCSNGSSGQCSDDEVLVDEHEFNHDSTDYAITQIVLRPTTKNLEIHFAPNLAGATRRLIFNVGTDAFHFTAGNTADHSRRIWTGSGLSWSSGDSIQLSLTEGGPPNPPTGLKASAQSSTQIDLDWTAPGQDGGAAISGYRIEVSTDGGTSWSNVVANTGDAATEYSDMGLAPGSARTYRVYAINSNGEGLASNLASAITWVEVPDSWTLAPAGLGAGDAFRLLFLSSTKRDATLSDIADYNTFVGNRAAAGHAAIQPHSSLFRVVGCTVDDDARDNTDTTYTATDTGAPIYWLGGNKAADDYEDFYDGSWDEEANNTNESGTSGPDTSQTANYPYTGCNHDGTKVDPMLVTTDDRFLGAVAQVRVGRPNSGSATDVDGPIGSDEDALRGLSVTRPFYGLSPVFIITEATVWSAMLTVQNMSGTLGCSNGFTGANCSTQAILSDDDFTYDGTDHSIHLIFLRTDGRLEIQSQSGAPFSATTRADLTLDVDGATFDLADSTITSGESVEWNNSGLIWVAGNTVQLSLKAAETPVTPPVVTTPGAPRNLTATPNGPTQIDLAWSAPASDGGAAISGYRIEVSPNGVSNWTLLVANTGNRRTYPHTGLAAETTRHYRVYAINSVGLGLVHSNVASATTTEPLSIQVSFSSAAFATVEGNRVRFSLRLSRAAGSPLTIPLTTTHRGGASAADYEGVPASVTFAAGETSKDIGIAILSDDLDDDGESLAVGLGALPAGLTPGARRQVVIQLLDADGRRIWEVWFGQSTYTAVEGGAAVVVTLGLSTPWKPWLNEPLVLPIGAEYRGGATRADHSQLPSQVTIPAGATRVSFRVSAVDDNHNDDGESIVLGLRTPLPEELRLRDGPREATVRLEDNDGTPAVTVAFDASVYTATEGGADAVVIVRLDRQPGREVEIPLYLSRHGGPGAADYSGVPESVTFSAGLTSRQFTVTATDDSVDDDDESIAIRFGPLPDGVSAGSRSRTVINLADDDGERESRRVRFGGFYGTSRVREGGSFFVDMYLDPPSAGSLSIPLTVTHLGGATAADYEGTPDTVTFADGENRSGFVVTVLENSEQDQGKGLRVEFGALPAGVRAGVSGRGLSRTLWFIDNDGPPAISVADASVREWPNPRSYLKFVVRLDRIVEDEVRVDYQTEDGTAVAGKAVEGGDYKAESGTLVFERHADSKNVWVLVRFDDRDEDTETMTLRLFNAVGGRITKGVAEGRIRDYGSRAAQDAGVAGTLLTLRYDGDLDQGSTPAPRDFVVSAEPPGGARAMLAVESVAVHGSEVRLRLERPVTPDETVALDYLPAAMHPILDADGLPAAPLADEPVRNDTDSGGFLPDAELPAGFAIPAALAVMADEAPEDAETARLDLSSRNLTDLSALAGRTGLRELDLRHNALTDLGPLAGLAGLRVLHLDGNRIADLAPLAGLAGLERLSLADNRIEDLAPLTGLAGLEALGLAGNRIADFWPLAGLTALERLDLSGNRIEELAVLTGLASLRDLDLAANRIADLRPLAALAGLERLDLAGNRVADLAPLTGLAGLEVLLLDRNRVADLLALSPLQGLAHLGLAGNQIADIGLLTQFGGLRRLDLTDNAVADVSALGDVLGLVWLRLPGNPVSNAAPLGRLTELRWLWLDADTATETEALAPPAGRAAPLLWIERAPTQ